MENRNEFGLTQKIEAGNKKMSHPDGISPIKGTWKSGLIEGMIAVIESRSGGLSAVLQLEARPVGYFDAPTLSDLLRLIEKHRGPGHYDGPTFEAYGENSSQAESAAEPATDSETPLSDSTLTGLLAD